MKTAVSVPDPVFERAEKTARRLGKSRSQLYSEALAEYVARHDPDEVTDAMDRVCEEVDSGPDAFLRSSATTILSRTEW